MQRKTSGSDAYDDVRPGAVRVATMVATVVHSIVTHKDQVSVDLRRSNGNGRESYTIEVRTAVADEGFVFGAGYSTINAIRRITMIAAKSEGIRITLRYLNDRSLSDA